MNEEHTQQEARPEGPTEKHLTFRLGGETYGIAILKVQEIINLVPVTRVPRTPGHVRGVINLRGKVFPVIDLRLKFGLPSAPPTEKTCIVVVQVLQADRSVVIGVMVDEVSEVLDIPASEIEPPPEFGAAVDTRFILGMAKARGGVSVLLDIDEVLVGEKSVVER